MSVGPACRSPTKLTPTQGACARSVSSRNTICLCGGEAVRCGRGDGRGGWVEEAGGLVGGAPVVELELGRGEAARVPGGRRGAESPAPQRRRVGPPPRADFARCARTGSRHAFETLG